ncbi:MAG: hypothetical protein JXR96_22285 [Deltaproteobacteria bacterium]|nr:hypothetical protein [Deltaproteobacteria bacterium]
MSRSMAAVAALAIISVTLPARAAWVEKYSAGSDDKALGFSIHSPDGIHVYACGVTMAVTNPFTDPIHRVLASDNGGESFRDISASLSGIMLTPTCVFFVDAEYGFLVIGNKLFRTSDGGETWEEFQLPDAAAAIHFHDRSNGLAVGEAGAIWSSADGGQGWSVVSSQASVSLTSIFFVDRQHGYITGNDAHEEGDRNVADHGQVLASSDGGASWQVAWETDGEFLGAAYFASAREGWVCGADNSEHIYLLHTVDTASTFQRVDLATTVADVTGQVAVLTGVRVAPGGSGKAIGVFATGMHTSQGDVYMIADYTSSDGGASWQLHVNDPGEGEDIQPEGAMLNACFYSDRLAWAVGSGLRIVKNAPPCSSDDDCFQGFVCQDGVCKPNTSGPCEVDEDCYGDLVCRNGVCSDPGPAACVNDEDCEGELVCIHGHCTERPGCDEEAPVGSQGCPFGQICVFGRCIQNVSCDNDEDCSSTQRCHEGHCVPRELPEYRCLDDEDCAAGERCVDTWCEWVGGEDGGTGSDAGSGDDGGTGPDAGQPADAGTGSDGGTQPSDGGGCGCGANPAVGLSVLCMALMFLGLLARRRD